jgi:hypothetical protein
VHRTIGEQNQDGGADVAALTAPASAAATARATEAEAGARVEAEAAPTWAESAEPGLEAGTERAVPVRAVLTQVLAEIAAGGPPVFVEGATLLRTESEAGAEPTGWGCEWVVHW